MPSIGAGEALEAVLWFPSATNVLLIKDKVAFSEVGSLVEAGASRRCFGPAVGMREEDRAGATLLSARAFN